jgi:hypothetical protein
MPTETGSHLMSYLGLRKHWNSNLDLVKQRRTKKEKDWQMETAKR